MNYSKGSPKRTLFDDIQKSMLDRKFSEQTLTKQKFEAFSKSTTSNLGQTGLTFKNQLSRIKESGFSREKSHDVTKHTLLGKKLSEGNTLQSSLFGFKIDEAEDYFEDRPEPSKAKPPVKPDKPCKTIDFRKTLPRNTFREIKVRHSTAAQAYAPNFQSIEGKKDKLCVPFDKSMGRDGFRPAISSRAAPLGKKLNLLAKVQREKEKPMAANQPRVSVVEEPEKIKREISRVSQRQVDKGKPNTTVGSARNGIISMDKHLPRSRDEASKFPTWMQKQASFSRIGVSSMGEKSYELNCYKDGQIRSYRSPGLRSKAADDRFKLKPTQDSSEEFGDLPSLD